MRGCHYCQAARWIFFAATEPLWQLQVRKSTRMSHCLMLRFQTRRPASAREGIFPSEGMLISSCGPARVPRAQGFARPTLPTPARPWRSRPARSRPPRRSPSRCRTRPPTHRPAAPAATLARRRHCSRDPARGSRIGSEPLSGKRRRAAPPQRNMG